MFMPCKFGGQEVSMLVNDTVQSYNEIRCRCYVICLTLIVHLYEEEHMTSQSS